jgi:hypothetical protein
LELYQIVGFGFCYLQETQEGGRRSTFVYRYIPPSLFHNNGQKIMGALNVLAASSTEGESIRLDDAPKEPDFAQSLTADGLALLESFPIYGILRIEEHALAWDAYWDEEPIITFRAGTLENLMQEVLSTPPQHLWAQRHLSTYARYLFGQNDPEAPALLMEEPDQKPSNNGGEDPPLPHALPEERIDYPWGLWKVVLVPLSDAIAAEAGQWEQTEEFRVVEGTLGILKSGRFTYQALRYLRWEIPASLVPNVVRWAQENDLKMNEKWAPISIMPSNDWESPIASIPNESEAEVGLAAAFIVPKSKDQMEPGFLEWFEAELMKAVSEK